MLRQNEGFDEVRLGKAVSLNEVEMLLKERWQAGDVRRALLAANRALRLNPHEPGYRYLRGHVYQCVGMIREAMSDFEAAAELASGTSRERFLAAKRALEDWQISVVHMLLEEDRTFRIEFAADPEAAVEKRGFALSKKAHDILLAVATDAARTQSIQIGFS